MEIDFSSLSPSKRYHLMTQSVIPRPIAWILSENTDSTLNLAPFSYFNAVCSDPALLMVSVGIKPAGDNKDTARNLQKEHPCVVHIPSVQHADAVTASAATLPYGESELDTIDTTLIEQSDFVLPRLSTCQIAFNCVVHDVMTIGATPQSLIFMEIKNMHIADEVVVQDAKGRDKFDASKIKPLARLGASEFSSISEVFTLLRPK
ncbi:MAG: flavin reductase family protein [Pseudomonadota bacterium]